jgi:hypothetical protein
VAFDVADRRCRAECAADLVDEGVHAEVVAEDAVWGEFGDQR